MNIKIEKKNSDKYVLFISSEDKIDGFSLNKEELLMLKVNLDEMLEYNLESTGNSV